MCAAFFFVVFTFHSALGFIMVKYYAQLADTSEPPKSK